MLLRVNLSIIILYLAAGCAGKPTEQRRTGVTSSLPDASAKEGTLPVNAYANGRNEMDSVSSRVYNWPRSFVSHAEGIKKATILEGSTTALQHLIVYAYEQQEGAVHLAAPDTEAETLLIVKEGTMGMKIGEKRQVLVPGSVAVIFPEDQVQIENEGSGPAMYYMFQYMPRKGVFYERAKEAGGSFLVDWNALEMQETEKGGVRRYFDQPTASFSRFEMHVTTLNEGLMSHPVHTHREEEFLLIRQGVVEEHIDGSVHKATPGDLIFLDAMVPHNITNVGAGQAVYFAFKWE